MAMTAVIEYLKSKFDQTRVRIYTWLAKKEIILVNWLRLINASIGCAKRLSAWVTAYMKKWWKIFIAQKTRQKKRHTLH